MSQSPPLTPNPAAEISKLRNERDYYENECRRLEALTAQLKVTYSKKCEQLEVENLELKAELEKEKAIREALQQNEVTPEVADQIMRASMQSNRYREISIDNLHQKIKDLENELAQERSKEDEVCRDIDHLNQRINDLEAELAQEREANKIEAK